MSDTPEVTAGLARFLVQSRWPDLPARMHHEAKRAVLNWLGCALGGARDQATTIAAEVLTPYAGPGEATVIGRHERPDMLTAAFLNGVSSNVFDFDDTHVPTVMHPSSPVAPALFALAEWRRTSGAELLHAFVLGVEAAGRVGAAISPWHYDHGWHITSTCGVIGAAAGVGKLLGLDEQRMVWALGNGATQAAGLVENLGFMAKSITVGNAPRNGLIAAMLAERGLTAAPQSLEGPRGFLQVTGQAPRFADVLDRLGETWELERTAYKPYPAGVVLHPVLDACLALRERHALSPDAIASVVVTGGQLLKDRADRPDPSSGREAQVSAQHSVAVAFVRGRAGVPEFSDAATREIARAPLRARVSVEVDDSVPMQSAIVTVRTTDGRSLREHVQVGRSFPGRPLTDADLEAKFREQAAFGAPGVDASRLIDAVWALDRASDASSLLPATVPPP